MTKVIKSIVFFLKDPRKKDFCDICRKLKPVYQVHSDKDRQEKWCDECLQEEEDIVENY